MIKIHNKRSVFITGVTGVLGSQIFKLFISSEDVQLMLLIRGKSVHDCRLRYRKLLDEMLKGEKIKAEIKIICGDITKKNLGIENKVYKQLCLSVSEIYHCAALTKFYQPLNRLRKINVAGTKNVLTFAQHCLNLKKFNYISTLFIAGTHQGLFREKDLDLGQDFNSPYEKSKFEAEVLIRKYFNKRYSIAIYRPGIIVGEYASGKVINFQMMFYQALRSFSLNLIKKLPFNSAAKLNLVPCDFAAKSIYNLSQEFDSNATYHIIVPENRSFLRSLKFASKYFGCAEPEYIDIKDFDMDSLGNFEKKLFQIYSPFFYFRTTFSAIMTSHRLKSIGVEYPIINQKFVNRLFDYCVQKKFILKNKSPC
ncbi:MAG: SDR family oxidoreductase [Candidatus Omnitrophica bacterium]|nr:SDR family oxidoreductase [Candidatus Omnitrophota bacterium]